MVIISKCVKYGITHTTAKRKFLGKHIYIPEEKKISIKEWSVSEKWSNEFLFPALINDNSFPLLICKIV